MNNNDIAVSVRNLTKAYRVFGHPGDRVKQALTFGRFRFYREFTALKDVSFDIRKGETVGVIGRNGSGKSTLLQLVCGILKPTEGTVRVNGRISALLELGAGFNPEFTGRENVYFQGAVMGLSNQEMNACFDEIATFADIGEFIDQPVRTYSSGMFVRLAFSTAVHVVPDILVVDEALAVGDAEFQTKCFERIRQIRDAGGSILLVTHSAEQVAHLCDRAILLEKGHLIVEGDKNSTLEYYISRIQSKQKEKVADPVLQIGDHQGDSFCNNPAYNSEETRWGDRAATIDDIHIFQGMNKDPLTYLSGQVIQLRLLIRFHASVEKPVYGLTIKSKDGAFLFGTNSLLIGCAENLGPKKSGDTVEASFSFSPFLNAGDYLVSVGVVCEAPAGVVVHDRRYDSIKMRIEHPMSSSGEVAMDPLFSIRDLV